MSNPFDDVSQGRGCKTCMLRGRVLAIHPADRHMVTTTLSVIESVDVPRGRGFITPCPDCWEPTIPPFVASVLGGTDRGDPLPSGPRDFIRDWGLGP